MHIRTETVTSLNRLSQKSITLQQSGFPQSLWADAGILHQSEEDRFLSNPFNFIAQLSPIHSTLYTLATKSVLNEPQKDATVKQR
jgi:hypothetical protein